MTQAKIPPKPGKETIYVDVDDEITSIIDKIEGAKEQVVALVLPKRSTALQSIVNMRLLKRHADGASKNVVLITTETALMPLAGAAGIHVAKTLTSTPEVPVGPEGASSSASVPVKTDDGTGPINLKEDSTEPENMPSKIDYDKSIGELASAHDYDNPETIELGADEEEASAAAAASEKLPKAPKNKALKVPNFDRFRLFLALGILGGIAFIVFIFLAIFVLPHATVAIQTTSTPVSATVNLQTSGGATAVNTAKGIIPGISKTSDQTATQQITATGQQNNGIKAAGTMVFYNCNQQDTLTGDNRTIAAGTGVSANGLTYITQQSVVVPPSHFVAGICQNDQKSNQVNVTAQSGGAKYNQDATTYAVAGYTTVSGTGSKMTGGTDNITTIVSQSDVDSAAQKLTNAGTSNFAKTFETQLASQDYYVFTSTLKTSDPQTTSSPAVGQAATSATVTVKVTYTVLAVHKTDLRAAIDASLISQIDKTKQKVDDSSVLTDSNISVTNQTSPTDATLNVAVNTSAIPIIDTNSIKKQVVGKKSGDITSQLSSIPGVKAVNVHFRPFWVSTAPSKTSKITVTIQHVNGS